MNKKLNSFYKRLGFDLMQELASELEGVDGFSAGGKLQAYQTIGLKNGMEIRFTPWRNGGMPYYIIFFGKNDNYAFELDLSMIVYRDELFSWHLKKPSNKRNVDFLNDWLGDLVNFEEDYKEEVWKIKKEISSGVNKPQKGFLFAERLQWDVLCERFLDLAKMVIGVHAQESSDVPVNFEEAGGGERDYHVTRKARRNQAHFRRNLILLYDSTCALTGCSVEETLEAAHIIGYAAKGNNHSDNGILLRSDIHRLFDKNMIGINPDTLKVSLSKEIERSEYSCLEGKKIRCRVDGGNPGKMFLEEKWEEGSWSK